MFHDEEPLEAPDERSCNRLHQQRRHNIKITKTANQILPRHAANMSSITRQGQMVKRSRDILPKVIKGSRKQTRSPARSWKREAIIHQDKDDDADSPNSSDDDQDGYIYHGSNSYESLRLSMSAAISEKDADYLSVLLRELKVNRDSTENLTSKRYWGRNRNRQTILSEVMTHGDFDCVQTVLDGIDRGCIPPTLVDHVDSNGRTALWHACRKGDLKLVRELVRHGRANVNKCGVLIVAVQNGYEKIVKYLLNKGCDPNRRAKNYNERALHAASRRNHLQIVKTLLQYGADPTILDDQKRTALDYAIHKRYLDIAKILIPHHDGRFFMSQKGFTPLMLAARCNNTPIVNIFSEILPRQQFLDELSLLACNYIIYGIAVKRDEAYCCFERALSMSTPLCNSELCEAYQFRSECQTLDELALIREDEDAMRMHALLVSERLLLQRNEIGHLLSLIIKQSNIYKWNGLLHRCLQLQMHAYHLVLQTAHNRRYDSLSQKILVDNRGHSPENSASRRRCACQIAGARLDMDTQQN